MIVVKEVDENGKPTVWEAVDTIPNELLPDGYPHYAPGVILEETPTIQASDPTFGTIWVIPAVPKAELGKTYTVRYNGTDYTCQCLPVPSAFTSDTEAVGFGNYAVAGGENTGEPFAMMISPLRGGIIILDLVGSSSVSVGISGDVLVPFDRKYLPGSTYTVVFDIMESNTQWNAKADKTYAEVARMSRDPNVLVRAFVRLHTVNINNSDDIWLYYYGELTMAWGDLYFAINGNDSNKIRLVMKSSGIEVIKT
jgi:hypothetical protein